MKKFAFAMVLAALAVRVFAYSSQTVGGITWKYTVENGGAVLYGNYTYSGSTAYYTTTIPQTTTGAVTIPSQLGGYPVTGIANYAFYKCEKITAITIPDTVKQIGSYAFGYCSALTALTIPNGVTAISSCMCYYCGALTSVVIPDGVASIGSSAFYNCTALATIHIPESVASVGSSAFSGTAWYNNAAEGLLVLDGCLIGIKGTSPSVVDIPEGCRLIADYGLSATGISSVNIPKSVTKIGSMAIGYSYSSTLTSITVSEDNLSYKSINGILYTKAGDALICCPPGKTSVVVPDGVTTIADRAFYYCRNMTSIILPEGLETIGNMAFYYCAGLKSLDLPNSLRTIGNSAFSQCMGLTVISIPNGVTSIGNSAFTYCTKLEQVNMPGNVLLGANIYANCASLQCVHVTDDVTVSAFKQKLQQATNEVANLEFLYGDFEYGELKYAIGMQDSLSVVGLSSQFQGGNVVIAQSVNGRVVTDVANRAFENAMEIHGVVIPDSILSIGRDAFVGCKNICIVTWDCAYDKDVIVEVRNGGWDEATLKEGKWQYTTGSSSVAQDLQPGIRWIVDGAGEIFAKYNASMYKMTQFYWYVDSEIGKNVLFFTGDSPNTGDKREDKISWSGEHRIGAAVLGRSEGTVVLSMQNVAPVFKDWFRDAKDLRVCVGEHVRKLRGGLFANCHNLHSIEIPENVDSIGCTTFYGCEGLTELIVSDENPKYKVVKGNLLTKDGKTLVWGSNQKCVIVPDGVECIGRFAFCEKLIRAIVFNDGLKEISACAFNGCNVLNALVLPPSVSQVGESSFSNLSSVEFLGKPPMGVVNSGLQNATIILFPRKYAGSWKQYATANNYAIRRGPTAAILSSKIRESDPTIMDVEYMVTSENPTVKVRALAFKNGVRSFANVVRPETFVDGTAINIGDAIEANVPHKLSWRVSADYGIELTKMKFEVIAQEGDLLPMEWIYIPKSEQYGKMKVSYNTLSEAQVFDALMWLYAAKDPGLTLSGGTLRGGGYTLASGAGLYNTQGSYVSGVGYTYNYNAHNYVFAKMGWSVLSGAVLNYANSETRKGLSPSGIRQYAYQIVE